MIEHELIFYQLIIILYDVFSQEMFQTIFVADTYKVGCVFAMVIWSEFCMGQYRDRDHREYAPDFTIMTRILSYGEIQWNREMNVTVGLFYFRVYQGPFQN